MALPKNSGHRCLFVFHALTNRPTHPSTDGGGGLFYEQGAWGKLFDRMFRERQAMSDSIDLPSTLISTFDLLAFPKLGRAGDDNAFFGEKLLFKLINHLVHGDNFVGQTHLLQFAQHVGQLFDGAAHRFFVEDFAGVISDHYAQ